MNLRELFKKPGILLAEGGNLQLPTGEQADEINLLVHNRTFMVGLLDKLLHDINNAFYAKYKTPLWSKELLQSKQFLGGSSLHFFNTTGISDEEFVAKKPKVGDIDTQCNKELEPQIEEFLTSIVGQQVGNAKFLGFSRGNEQLNGLFELQDPPIKIQIDFEFGRYAPETNAPDEWYRFSHSSAWNDVQAGIKGVFHKYIYRALAKAGPTEKYIAKLAGAGKNRKMTITGPVTDANFSFAVASKGGGGARAKYKPYIDPETGEEKVINGIPVMEPVSSSDSEYIQQLSKQFELFFGQPPEGNDLELQQSFLGTLELMNKYLDDNAKQVALTELVDICFEPGSQMITKDDPTRDREIKFAAIDQMIEKLGLQAMRPAVIAKAKEYEQDYLDVEEYKKAHPDERQPRAALKKQRAATAPTTESLDEADEEPKVKAQLRKGMPHLHDLKPADLLDLLDEIHDGNGRFKLQNIPLNVKVDGFGGRFGKNADGKPFMGTSRTEPRYQAGFVDYHQKKGTTDPEVLGRAKLFDDLFNEMMKAVKMVDSKLGPDFLVNKQVTCEVLYLPFATETPEGKLKFVGIHYDQLPEGVTLALVPFRVTDSTTGEDLPDAQQIVKELTSVGQMGSVMFIDNSLTQNEALDVTAIVPPMENIEQLKAMLADKSPGSIKRKQQVVAALAPVATALEDAIIKDPNIIGKDMLGKDYEGIVINSRMGPIKVTSTEQRDVIANKQAAKVAANTEHPRDNQNKTAVVAIGSFVGHVGHEQLFDYTIKKAAAVNGDPYLFIGNAVGKDDPIPPAVKVQTWHKLYPEYANQISTVQAGGTLMQKIKHELINPQPGKPPRYDNIIIMVGEDQANMPIAQALMKSVNKFPGYEHVKVTLEATPRGTGMSFSKLRNILKDPNATEQQQLAMWSQAFDMNKLGKAWIEHLMDLTRQGMGIQKQPAPVVAERLSNSLIRPRKLSELSTEKLGQYKKAAATSASTADAAGDVKKGNKRFQGITKATNKQFANATKPVAEDYHAPDWLRLGEGMSIADKISIFESYYANGALLESNDHSIKYFEGLLKYSSDLEKNKKYIVTPLMLVQNKVVSLNTDLLTLTFLSHDGNTLVFEKPNGSLIKFPEDFEGEQGITHTFVFNNLNSYNNFRSALALKFNLNLPDASDAIKSIKEEKKKGADGKACWKGYKYAGTKNGKDKCVPISESYEQQIANIIDRIIANEAIQNNKR